MTLFRTLLDQIKSGISSLVIFTFELSLLFFRFSCELDGFSDSSVNKTSFLNFPSELCELKMLVSLIIVGLLASSTLALPIDQQQLVNLNGGMQLFGGGNNYMERIKSYKDLPLPRLTKNMEPREWFEVFEKRYRGFDVNPNPFYKDSFLYYVDAEVVECNLAALKLPYDQMKNSFKKCN